MERDELYDAGINYYEGINGVEQDYAKAVEYFREAAEQEHAKAQYYLGLCYLNGDGVEQDFQESIDWYEKAANNGDEDAQFVIEEMNNPG